MLHPNYSSFACMFCSIEIIIYKVINHLGQLNMFGLSWSHDFWGVGWAWRSQAGLHGRAGQSPPKERGASSQSHGIHFREQLSHMRCECLSCSKVFAYQIGRVTVVMTAISLVLQRFDLF